MDHFSKYGLSDSDDEDAEVASKNLKVDAEKAKIMDLDFVLKKKMKSMKDKLMMGNRVR